MTMTWSLVIGHLCHLFDAVNWKNARFYPSKDEALKIVETVDVKVMLHGTIFNGDF